MRKQNGYTDFLFVKHDTNNNRIKLLDYETKSQLIKEQSYSMFKSFLNGAYGIKYEFVCQRSISLFKTMDKHLK